MPVIRTRSILPNRDQFVRRIVDELLGEGSPDNAPIIFETPTTDPTFSNVMVVWDAFRPFPPDDRSWIIADAYSRFGELIKASVYQVDPNRPAPLPPRASTAQGATREEVTRLCLLPYGIKTILDVAPTNDRLAALKHVFRDLGALDSGRSLELLLPSETLRSEASGFLRQRFPDITFEPFDLQDPESD